MQNALSRWRLLHIQHPDGVMGMAKESNVAEKHRLSVVTAQPCVDRGVEWVTLCLAAVVEWISTLDA